MEKRCSICKGTSEQCINVEKQWDSYGGSTYFGDEVHEYVFCEECIHDMALGKPLKGRLHGFIKGDPNISWGGIETIQSLPKEKQTWYSEEFLDILNNL